MIGSVSFVLQRDIYLALTPYEDLSITSARGLRPRTHGNVFLRFYIVSSNELVVLDSLENSKQYKNAGKHFRVYGALHLTAIHASTNKHS